MICCNLALIYRIMENNKIIVVLPAYNCSKTLESTVSAIPAGYVSDIILVDDCSSDCTIEVANRIGLSHIYRHDKNKGYGANQKTCYDAALGLNADIIIMLHPDYQYDPKLIPCIIDKLANGAEVVLGSRMNQGKEAIRLGMPIYKYYSNKFLTAFQNILLKQNLSEYHTGYRAYTKEVLKTVDYCKFSDDFIFDNQMMIDIIKNKFTIDEVYCPAKYFADSSSINFKRSLKYGLGVIYHTIKSKFQK